MQFHGLAGNDHTKRRLAADIDADRFPHALLIEGPPGSGRRTLARLVAKAAVCRAQHPAQRPCGVCPACIKAAAGSHPDIEEIGGDGAARSFHIDVVRQLRGSTYVLPNESPRRVLILAGANAMTEQAQNALLKILEEPPAHVLFVLTCENRSQLLPTVQSRCMCVTLGGVAEEEALAVLRERLPHAEETDLRRAVQVFGGVIGQALDGMENGTFQRVLQLAPAMALAVTEPFELALLKQTAAFEKDKDTLDGVLRGMLLLFRDALVRRSGADSRLSTSPETAEQLAKKLSRVQLMRLIGVVEELQRARLRNMNHTLFLTLLCSRLREAAGHE